MTLEYVLLLSVFVFTLMGAFMKGPKQSFNDSGPLLGARIEKLLVTGDGFTTNSKAAQAWNDHR